MLRLAAYTLNFARLRAGGTISLICWTSYGAGGCCQNINGRPLLLRTTHDQRTLASGPQLSCHPTLELAPALCLMTVSMTASVCERNLEGSSMRWTDVEHASAPDSARGRGSLPPVQYEGFEPSPYDQDDNRADVFQVGGMCICYRALLTYPRRTLQR